MCWRFKVCIWAVFCLCGFLRVAAQDTIPLYVSKQTGQSSVFQGKASRKTEKDESLRIEFIAPSPLRYETTPREISIEPNKEGSWQGKLWVEAEEAPPPGESVSTLLIGRYSHYFGKLGKGAKLKKKGTEAIPFKVFSLDLKAPDSLVLCPGRSARLEVAGYPQGGKYLWTGSPGVEITSDTSRNAISVRANGAGHLIVTYSIGEVSFSRTVRIQPQMEKARILMPDTLFFTPGQIVEVKPDAQPGGGSFSWESVGMVALLSSQFSYAAILKAKSLGEGQATVSYKLCGKTVHKNISLQVKPCLVSVPDSVYTLLDKTVGVVATGTPSGGLFYWREEGNIEEEGDSKSRLCTVKGVELGKGWLHVQYKKDGCRTEKTVGVRVLPKVKLEVSPLPLRKLWKCESLHLTSKGYPEGGTYHWQLPAGWKLIGENYRAVITAEAGTPGHEPIICTYTKEGQTARIEIPVQVVGMKELSILAEGKKGSVTHGKEITYHVRAVDDLGEDRSMDFQWRWRKVWFPISGAAPQSRELIEGKVRWNLEWEKAPAFSEVTPPVMQAYLEVWAEDHPELRVYLPVEVSAGKIISKSDPYCKETGTILGTPEVKEQVVKTVLKGNPSGRIWLNLSMPYVVRGKVQTSGLAGGSVVLNGPGVQVLPCHKGADSYQKQLFETWDLTLSRSPTADKTVRISRIVQTVQKSWATYMDVTYSSGLKISFLVGSGTGMGEESRIEKTVTPP